MGEARILIARCGGCGARLRVKTRQAEKVVPCPKCGSDVIAGRERPAAVPGDLPAGGPRGRGSGFLTPAEARAVIRPIAEKHRAKGVLKQLAAVNEAKAAKAVQSYAGEWEDDEAALLVVDASFLQNGSAGLLLTNLFLYSSSGQPPIRLAEVFSAAYERPTELERALVGSFGVLYFLAGGERLRDRLVVNGEVVCEQKINFACWVEALVALGDASRALGVGTGLVRRLQQRPRLVAHVGGAIAAGRTDLEIRSRLVTAGAPPGDIDRLVSEMRTIYGRRKIGVGVGVTLGGAGLAGLGVALTLASDGTWIWYGAILCGTMLFCVGVTRLISGDPPLRTKPLIDAWGAEYG